MALKTYTLDTASADEVRAAYDKLLAQHRAGKDDRRLGWWIANNAAEVTVRTTTGAVIRGSGAELLAKIDAHHAHEIEQDRQRAA